VGSGAPGARSIRRALDWPAIVGALRAADKAAGGRKL